MVIRDQDRTTCTHCGSKLEGEQLDRYRRNEATLDMLRAQAEITARYHKGRTIQHLDEGSFHMERDMTGDVLDLTYLHGFWRHTATGNIYGAE